MHFRESFVFLGPKRPALRVFKDCTKLIETLGRSNQVIVPSARILLGPVFTNFTQTQNTNKEINLPHETAHTSLRPSIQIKR